MLQYILWGVSFITLWLTLIWLNFLYLDKGQKTARNYPSASLCVPAYNEENTILKTLKSLVNLNYPSKVEIIVVDDGSTDNTVDIVKQFNHPSVKLIQKQNGGKASAVNEGLAIATGEVFGVVDADSRVDSESLRHLIPYFEDEKCGAVISRIKVDSPKNFLERLQRFEYIMSNMLRKVMHNLGTLCVTPGVLSVYKTAVLRKVGGFTQDKENITEDLEIALRLKANGYTIHMEPNSITHTKVPKNIDSLWKQRVRWSRGYIYNHVNYRRMFLSKKHGFFGTFQFPINVLAIGILMMTTLIILVDFVDKSYTFLVRSLTLPDYFTANLLNLPTLKEFVLSNNVQISLPLVISFALGVYLMWYAIKAFKESWKNQVGSIFAYFLLIPYFTAANWVASIYKEVVRSKRKW